MMTMTAVGLFRVPASARTQLARFGTDMRPELATAATEETLGELRNSAFGDLTKSYTSTLGLPVAGRPQCDTHPLTVGYHHCNKDGVFAVSSAGADGLIDNKIVLKGIKPCATKEATTDRIQRLYPDTTVSYMLPHKEDKNKPADPAVIVLQAASAAVANSYHTYKRAPVIDVYVKSGPGQLVVTSGHASVSRWTESLTTGGTNIAAHLVRVRSEALAGLSPPAMAADVESMARAAADQMNAGLAELGFGLCMEHKHCKRVGHNVAELTLVNSTAVTVCLSMGRFEYSGHSYEFSAAPTDGAITLAEDANAATLKVPAGYSEERLRPLLTDFARKHNIQLLPGADGAVGLVKVSGERSAGTTFKLRLATAADLLRFVQVVNEQRGLPLGRTFATAHAAGESRVGSTAAGRGARLSAQRETAMLQVALQEGRTYKEVVLREQQAQVSAGGSTAALAPVLQQQLHRIVAATESLQRQVAEGVSGSQRNHAELMDKLCSSQADTAQMLAAQEAQHGILLNVAEQQGQLGASMKGLSASMKGLSEAQSDTAKALAVVMDDVADAKNAAEANRTDIRKLLQQAQANRDRKVAAAVAKAGPAEPLSAEPPPKRRTPGVGAADGTNLFEALAAAGDDNMSDADEEQENAANN